MKIKGFAIRVLSVLFLVSAVSVEWMHTSDTPRSQNGNWVLAAASSTQSGTDVRGTWSGTFISRNADMSPFTITVVISSDSSGHLIGNSNLVSECLDTHRLQVTVNGSNIVLAGSDAKGDTVTFTGTIDNTGTLLTLTYIINGSASARCEIDNGSGTMGKR